MSQAEETNPKRVSAEAMSTALQDPDTIFLFKEFLKQHHASEYLTAFAWLCKIRRLPEADRGTEMLKFWLEFLSNNAPRQIHTELACGGYYDIKFTTAAVLLQIYSELEDALLSHWLAFSTSPVRRRLAASRRGQNTTVPASAVNPRTAAMARVRVDSDEYCVDFVTHPPLVASVQH